MLHATETGISSGLMSHLARMQTLPLPTSWRKQAWSMRDFTQLKVVIKMPESQTGKKVHNSDREPTRCIIIASDVKQNKQEKEKTERNLLCFKQVFSET